jgi:hypothetical protein
LIQLALIFFIVFLKLNFAATPTSLNIWVVGNVGQGQWVTHIIPDECIHYDAGGEFGSFYSVKNVKIRIKKQVIDSMLLNL